MNYYPNDIYHWGIKGMHWGVRRYQNPDGTLTAAGRERYKMSEFQKAKIQNELSKADAYTDVSDKVFKIAKADKRYLKEARKVILEKEKELSEITKQTDEMFGTVRDTSNHPNKAYYQAVSEIANYGDAEWLNKDINNITMREIDEGAWQGIFEDGQQSKINAKSMYAYKNNLEDKVNKLLKDSIQIEEDQKKEATRLVKTALEEVGGENLSAFKKNSDYKAYEAVAKRMLNNNPNNGNYMTTYELRRASKVNDFTEKNKKDIKAVEGWVSKLDNNGDENTWDLLGEAIENLGMNNKKASEMTQADWDKLNAEIRKLR